MAGRRLSGSLAERLEKHGLADELRRLDLLVEDGRRGKGFTVAELHDFCAGFTDDDLRPFKMPTIAQLKSTSTSIRRARRELTALLPLLPRSFRFDEEVQPATLVRLLNNCAAAVDTLREQMGTARDKLNPSERFFRALWELMATRRTREPLDSIGTILFNATFGANIDEASYARMVRRDRVTLKVPTRNPDRTTKLKKSR